MYIHERRRLDHRARWSSKGFFEEVLTRFRRKQIYGDPVDLERELRAHRHETARMVVESFGADEEAHDPGRARVPVRSDGEAADDDVPHLGGRQRSGCQLERFEHLGSDDINEQRRIGFRHAAPSWAIDG